MPAGAEISGGKCHLHFSCIQFTSEIDNIFVPKHVYVESVNVEWRRRKSAEGVVNSWYYPLIESQIFNFRQSRVSYSPENSNSSNGAMWQWGRRYTPSICDNIYSCTLKWVFNDKTGKYCLFIDRVSHSAALFAQTSLCVCFSFSNATDWKKVAQQIQKSDKKETNKQTKKCLMGFIPRRRFVWCVWHVDDLILLGENKFLLVPSSVTAFVSFQFCFSVFLSPHCVCERSCGSRESVQL